MLVWVAGVLLLGISTWCLWRLYRTTQDLKQKENQIREKDSALQEKDKALEESRVKHAKTQARLTELEHINDTKKRNLANYRRKKRTIRREKQSLEDYLAEIVAKKDRWVNHSSKQPKSHKMGKPVGSRGGGRKRPTVIHQEIDLYPQECDECGTSLAEGTPIFSHDAVMTDLPHEWDEYHHFKVMRLRNIQRNIYRIRCPQCKKLCSPDLGLFANARIGPGLVAYVISHRIEFGLPYNLIIQDLIKSFGPHFALTVPTIVGWFKKFEEQIQHIYFQLEDLLDREFFAHIDETGFSFNGQNFWLWVVSCANIVLFRAHESRGHQAIEDLIQNYEGTIICDFFSAYEKFTDNPQQKCLQHLLSDIIEHLVHIKKENHRIERKMEEHHEAVARDAAKKAEDYTAPQGRPKDLVKLPKEKINVLTTQQKRNEKRLQQTVRLLDFFRQPFTNTIFGWRRPIEDRITKAEAETKLTELIGALKEERLADEDLARLVKRCEKFKPRLFTYLQSKGMPPDNNKAERDLRHFSRLRKLAGDFKSMTVFRNYTMYLSLFMTCKQNKWNFQQILNLLLQDEPVDLRALLEKE